MGGNLNERYKTIIEFLHSMSFPYCDELGIQIDINVLNEDMLNAGVRCIKENLYCIDIFSGCLNLDYKIENMTERYTSDDLQFFWRVKELGIFERFENDTYRQDLNNLFATVILLHIYFHECGHILAKHVDISESMYEECDSERKGSYEIQEHEMVADWLSTIYVYQLMFHAVVQGNNLDSEEIIAILRQITVLWWLSLTIEFQLFDSKHMKPVEDFSVLTHPHPAVRLYYNLDAMKESMVDILNTYGLDDAQAEKAVNYIVEELYIYIASFLQITNAPISIKKDDVQIIECYIKLRDVPYKNGVEDSFVHLMPLSDKYRDVYEKYKVLQKRRCEDNKKFSLLDIYFSGR